MKDLSKLDLQVWGDAEAFERQNRLKSQFWTLFSNLGNEYPHEKVRGIHSGAKGAKLSQGNNLVGLPYQVLDIGRDFDPDSGLNVRLLNWFSRGVYLLVYLGKFKSPSSGSALLDLGFILSQVSDPFDYPGMFEQDQNPKKDLSSSFTDKKITVYYKPLEIQDTMEPYQRYLSSELKKVVDIL
ncbi:hypothetical protein [Algoriphagus namhaensis]